MRVRQVFLALALAVGLVLLTAVLLARGSSTVQARQNASEASVETPGTTTPGDVAIQGSGAVWAIETVDDPKFFCCMGDRSLTLDSTDHPRIAYGGDHLYYAWHNDSVWQYQVVDPAPSVGSYASIKLDSDDHPHISYHDSANEDLKYAHWTGSTWDVQTVDSEGSTGAATSLALDSAGHPHIAYYGWYCYPYDPCTFYLRYAHWTGSAWYTQTVTRSGSEIGEISLAVDSQNRPHIGYSNRYGYPSPKAHGTLNYARWTGGAWVTQRLAMGGIHWSPSLVLDSNDHPHISYEASIWWSPYFAHQGIEYIYWTGSVWITETVESSSDQYPIRYTSLALDSDGNPHVSYYHSFNSELRYAYRIGKNWVTQTVDSSGDIGISTSLVLDSNNHSHIIYFHSTTNSLKYAHGTGNGWWTTESIAHRGGLVGSDTSLALDSENHPHISHFDSAFYDLKYAHWTSNAWVNETVDSGGNVGWHTSLALDSDDHPHIAYRTNDGAKYARRTGSIWISEMVDGDFGRECTSLALDSAGYPHISYNNNVYGNLKYAHWTGSAWMREIVDYDGGIARDTSLALDSSGYPHIGYFIYAYPDYNLRYAYWTGSTWVIETVVVSTMASEDISLVLDSDNYPHISYQKGGDLKYIHWTGSAWISETVDSGDVGGYNSLALGFDSYPHISYYDASNADLKYAHWTGSAWISETVDSDGDVGMYTSLALDSDGYPHISYYDASNGTLKYTRLIPSLRLDKCAVPLDGLRNNDTLTYTLVISSSGLDVRLWDPLPENVLYISNSLTGTLTPPATYSPTARAVVWEGTLSPGAVHEVRFQVTPGITGTEALSLSLPIVNTAWVTSTHSGVGTSATVIVNAYRVYFPVIRKHH